MVSLQRNKNPLYLCKKYVDEQTNITKFKKPENAISINWQPISSDSQVLGLGVEYSKYIRIKGTKDECSVFNNKDRVFVYKKPDLENFDEMCNDADYEVEGSPVITLNDGEVMLKRLSGDDYYGN